ncbi:hypothetical protein ACTS94_02690 [Empedobacter falsenii]
MKKIIFLVLLNTMFACQSQNIKIMTPAVDNKFEIYKTPIFDKIIEESNLIKRGYVDNKYIEVYSNKIILETSKDLYFSTYKEYFTNNNIKLKGLRYNNNNNNNIRDPFRKGIWYEFDENEKLIKETNYDEPYKFTFEDILKFCEKEKIPIDKGPILQSTGYHITIRRGVVDDGKPWWEIKWLKTPDTIETIKLNGETGEILSRTDQHYINN